MRQGHLLARFALISLFAISPLAQAQSSSLTTIAATPPGAQFNVDGQNYNQAVSAIWPQGSKHVLSALPLQTDPSTGSQMSFTNWSWSGGSFNQSTITITADPAISKYTAVFNLAYQFSVQFYPCSDSSTFSPGTVVVNSTPYTCDVQAYFGAGSSVVVQALPNPGYIFAGWTNGNGQTIIGFQNTIMLNGPMRSLSDVRADARYQYRRLAVRLDAAGRSSAYHNALYTAVGILTVHTLGAITPQRDVHGNWWVFSSWSDGGALNHAYTVASVSTPDTVTANYVQGAGATFTTSPGGLNLTVDGVSDASAV